MNNIKYWWLGYWRLWISLVIVCMLFTKHMVNAYFTYVQLREVTGIVEKINYHAGKRSTLGIKLQGDDKIYYQYYRKRFHDKQLYTLRPDEKLTFYTTPELFHRTKPLITADDYKDFYYYPIFNINAPKSIVSVFFSYLYETSFLSVILIFAVAFSLFYSITIITVCKWPKCLLMLLFAGMFVWLLY